MSKRMVSKISAIAIDMDHTLLDSEFRLNVVDAHAIKKIKDSGLIVIIATGRMPEAVRKKITSIIECVDYAVCYNGALVLDSRHKEIIYSCEVPWDLFYNMYQRIDRDIYHIAVFSFDNVYVAGGEEDEMIKAYRQRTGAYIQEIEDIEMIKHLPVHKCLVYKKNVFKGNGWIDDSERELSTVVKKIAGEVLNVIKTRLGYVECINKNVSKWTSIKKVIELNHLTDEQVMCIGDGYNDIEMVKNSGFGVAVDNAIKELKDVADVIVANNDSCGVAEAIEFVLKQQQAR